MENESIEEKELERAPYWQELLDNSVPRIRANEIGAYFTRTHSWSGKIRDCRVLEVNRDRRFRFLHPGGIIAVSNFLPGDAVVRKGRNPTEEELKMAKALTGHEIDRVEVGARFHDPNASYRALRAYGRNIEESILGIKESVLGQDIELPGQIHRLLDEASKMEALDKASGILATASELLRIINKTRLGFRSTWSTLGGLYGDLAADRLKPHQLIRRIESVIAYLQKIGRIDPFYTWAQSGILELDKDEPQILMAMARIKKGWQGEIVSSDELDRVRKRIARAREKQE